MFGWLVGLSVGKVGPSLRLLPACLRKHPWRRRVALRRRLRRCRRRRSSMRRS